MEAATANQKLRKAKNAILVLEGSNDGIWDWYCATDEVYCNDRLLEIMDVGATTLASPPAFTELMHPEDLPKIRAVIHDHLIHGENVLQNFGFATLWEYRYLHCQRQSLRDARDAFADVRYTQRPE